MRRQKEGEPADSFITLLASRTLQPSYKIRYQIIVGLQDSNLSERLQTYPELNLDKAITMARRKEAVREQQAVVGARQATLAQELRKQSTVTATKKLRTMFQVSKIPKQPTRKVALDVVVSNTSKYLAREATCRKCKKQRHYQSVCRSVTNLATIKTDIVNQETFLGTIKIPTGIPMTLRKGHSRLYTCL